MAVLKLLKIDSSVQNAPYEDVPADQIEKGAVIRVRKLNIAGQMRLSNLTKNLEELSLDQFDLSCNRMVASLMCCMVDEDGKYLVPGGEDEILSTRQYLETHNLFSPLMVAHNNVNGLVIDTEKTDLEAEKKSS
ncbi:hypothetical protein [Vibrio phage Artemius]|nr:hypothetical protein [Vibrio phage Artemius]